MAQQQFLHAPIILLKEGTDTSQGKPQIISNINVCQSVVEMIRTTLGPRGMDKLIHDANNNVTITNDGATVIDLLNIVHPAGRLLVDIAKAQDDEVGDGTTSVVVIAGELLGMAKTFLEEGMAPRIIIAGYKRACQLAIKELEALQLSLGDKSDQEKRQLLERCAQTSLNSKLLSGYKEKFAKIVVDAVSTLDDMLDRNLIGIKKVPGGSVTESTLVDGVAFKKTFSYAGFEQQPKYFKNAKVLLLNIELEHKAEKENAEIRIDSPEEYLSIVNAEWKIIFDKLEKIVSTGANVVLSRLPIGDLATQFFADRQVFCAGRVDDADMQRTCRATGAQVLTSLSGDPATALGTCGEFKETQIGSDRYNIFQGCPKTKTVTIILRGGAPQFIDEAERSLNDAIQIVRRAIKTNVIVPGGGAIEMQLSRRLRDASRHATGKEQLIIAAFAQALEVIPRTLAQNSGLDASDIMNQLRRKHNEGKPENAWTAVDCLGGKVFDAYAEFVWEPALVKHHALQAATEAACAILSIDETIKHSKSTPEPQRKMPPAGVRGARF